MMQHYDLELEWRGPYSWVDPATTRVFRFPEVKQAGVYLWTIPYDDGYLIYYVGQTHLFQERLKDHLGNYRSGGWRVFDPAQFALGTQELLWRGFYDRKIQGWEPTPEEREQMREEWDGSDHLRTMLEQKLANFRLFVAPLPKSDQRLRKLVEAAIIRKLRETPGIVSEFMDDYLILANSLARRGAGELERVVKMTAPVRLLGLPSVLLV
jgi:hypothetical protein